MIDYFEPDGVRPWSKLLKQSERGVFHGRETFSELLVTHRCHDTQQGAEAQRNTIAINILHKLSEGRAGT